MVETTTCPRCGRAIPADAPQGLCPECLLRASDVDEGVTAGVTPGESAEAPGAGGSQRSSGRDRPAAPGTEEIARLFPHLEIQELLGQGGMGIVYKARQPGLDRLVALKILPPDATRDPEFAERFIREARALAKLSHPNIVPVYDFGEADGHHFFLMEYVDGVNLRQMMRVEKLSSTQALAIIPQICDALHYAHGEGIIHRDIKPENILVDRRGRVKIVDFGLAKLLARAQGDYTLTSPQHVMGTLHYMAPEQMERPREVDHRADIYSLGVVFYEMLTGELPLGRFPPPSAKGRTDARLDGVVLKALDREPEKRYQSASDLRTDVETATSEGTAAGAGAPAAARAGAGPVLEAVSAVGATAAGAAPVQPRICALPVIGAVWAALGSLGLAAFLFTWMMPVRHEGAGGGVDVGGFPIWGIPILFLAVLGLLAPIGATTLGALGISRIRHSAGRLIGMPLAVAVALFYPLLFLDGILAGLAAWLVRHMAADQDNAITFIIPVFALLLIVAVDLVIVRATWRAATRG